MATASLSASSRANAGKGVARSLRRDGKVPGVIYGHTRAPQALALDARELGRLLERIAAETTVIELSIDGGTSRTLIREIQRHPVKRTILHVDFQELVVGEMVTVAIPLVITGTPVGVRLSGGILTQVTNELQCRVDPANIPNHIDVDVATLDIGDSVHVSDLTIPEGVEVLDDESTTIVNLSAPKTSDDTATAEPSLAEPEVIRAKVKGDEEGGESKK